MEHLRAQYEEFLVLQSMFYRSTELEYDEEGLKLLSTMGANYENHDNFRFAIHCKDMEFEGIIPILSLEYPEKYPEELLCFEVHHPLLPRVWIEALREELKQVATKGLGQVVVLDLYQSMVSILETAHADLRTKRQSEGLTCASMVTPRAAKCKSMTRSCAGGTPTLGRRAIYFHHIAAGSKRHALINWAKELRLGGYSKIGWPGIVIVEGAEQNVQEYVRRVQRLRWKQMVVRGEQVEPSSRGEIVSHERDDSESNDVDAILYRMRKFKQNFQELPMDCMSKLAQICTDAGLKDLFLTTMKIYSAASEKCTSSNLHRKGDGTESGLIK